MLPHKSLSTFTLFRRYAGDGVAFLHFPYDSTSVGVHELTGIDSVSGPRSLQNLDVCKNMARMGCGHE